MIHPDKGLLRGRCNRTSCQRPGAAWFNTSTRAYYCQPCALDISHFAKRAEGYHICFLTKGDAEKDDAMVFGQEYAPWQKNPAGCAAPAAMDRPETIPAVPDEVRELLPCPFCGAPAHIPSRLVSKYGETVEYVVTCTEAEAYCPAACMHGFTPNKGWAIAAWNRRASRPSPSAADAPGVEVAEFDVRLLMLGDGRFYDEQGGEWALTKATLEERTRNCICSPCVERRAGTYGFAHDPHDQTRDDAATNARAEQMERERDEARADAESLRERLCIGPQGEDEIDVLSDAVETLRAALTAREAALADPRLASMVAEIRQGQSSMPRCEPPSEADVEIAEFWVGLIRRAVADASIARAALRREGEGR